MGGHQATGPKRVKVVCQWVSGIDTCPPLSFERVTQCCSRRSSDSRSGEIYLISCLKGGDSIACCRTREFGGRRDVADLLQSGSTCFHCEINMCDNFR